LQLGACGLQLFSFFIFQAKPRPMFRAEANVISDLTPDPAILGYLLVTGSGLKFI